MSTPNTLDPSWQRAFTVIESTLPDRSLKLKNVGHGHVMIQLLTIIGLFLGSIFLFVSSLDYVKDIYLDNKLVDNYIILEDVEIFGECDRSYFMNYCNIEIEYQDQLIKHNFRFFAMDAFTDEVEVIAQKDNPNNISTDVAVDNIKARIFATIILLSAGLLLFVWNLKEGANFLRKHRIKRAMNDPANQPWQFTAVQADCSLDCIDFTTMVNNKEQSISMDLEKIKTSNIENRKPLSIAQIESGKYWVLAIRAKNTKTVLPLTKGLSNIDFSEQEKAVLLKVINSQLNL